MENEKINLFKKEFQDEIDNLNVTLDDLKKVKLTSNVLSAEITLRKTFGDDIFVPKKKEESVDGEKTIVKLSEDDIAFDSEVREICDNLPDSKFDANVGVVLSKVADREE